MKKIIVTSSAGRGHSRHEWWITASDPEDFAKRLALFLIDNGYWPADKMKDLVCNDTPPAWVDSICEHCRDYDETISEDTTLCRPCQEEAAWDAYQERLAEWAG